MLQNANNRKGENMKDHTRKLFYSKHGKGLFFFFFFLLRWALFAVLLPLMLSAKHKADIGFFQFRSFILVFVIIFKLCIKATAYAQFFNFLVRLQFKCNTCSRAASMQSPVSAKLEKLFCQM